MLCSGNQQDTVKQRRVYPQSLSRVRLFVTPWTVACQAPLSMRFSRQEYWSGLPDPPSGDLPHPGMEAMSPVLQVGSLLLSPWGSSQSNYPPVKENIVKMTILSTDSMQAVYIVNAIPIKLLRAFPTELEQ